MRTDNPVKPGAAVRMKAVWTATEIFFLVRWGDDTNDSMHNPFKWFEPQSRYIDQPALLEDQFSIAFPIGKGDFLGDMLRKDQAVWDVWQWGACRTPDGFARDRLHEYTSKDPKLGKAAAGASAKQFQERGTNKPMWIVRRDDAGTAPYKERTDRPKPVKTEEFVQRYTPQKPDKSAADVRAKGVWKDELWVLEMGRKLDTGDAKGDIKFDGKKDVPFAVGVFDHDKEDVHSTSKVARLTFK
jgi:hypothetical protein